MGTGKGNNKRVSSFLSKNNIKTEKNIQEESNVENSPVINKIKSLLSEGYYEYNYPGVNEASDIIYREKTENKDAKFIFPLKIGNQRKVIVSLDNDNKISALEIYPLSKDFYTDRRFFCKEINGSLIDVVNSISELWAKEVNGNKVTKDDVNSKKKIIMEEFKSYSYMYKKKLFHNTEEYKNLRKLREQELENNNNNYENERAKLEMECEKLKQKYHYILKEIINHNDMKRKALTQEKLDLLASKGVDINDDMNINFMNIILHLGKSHVEEINELEEENIAAEELAESYTKGGINDLNQKTRLDISRLSSDCSRKTREIEEKYDKKEDKMREDFINKQEEVKINDDFVF